MKSLVGEWTVIDHMVRLSVGNTALLVDGHLSVREALNLLIINAPEHDLEGKEINPGSDGQ